MWQRAIVSILILVPFSPNLVRLDPVGSYRPVQSVAPIVVLVEKANSEVVCRIGPHKAKDSEGLMKVLDNLFDERGRETPILVLVDDRLSIAQFERVSGIAYKIGFLNFRYFAFGPDRRFMTEVRFDRAVPFAVDPRSE